MVRLLLVNPYIELDMKPQLPFLFVLTILFAFAFTGPTGKQWQDKVDPVLLEKSGQDAVEFIVMMDEQADVSEARLLNTKSERAHFVFNTLNALATNTQVEARQVLDQAGATYRSFYIVNAIWTKGDIDLIQQLAELESVSALIENPLFKQSEIREEAPNMERGPETVEWGIQMMNADDVWALGYTGQGVVVGGQDTGYDWGHPALAQKYRGFNNGNPDHNYNWHDAIHEISPLHNDPDPNDPNNNPCGLDVTEPCDDLAHGTHTMGTMIGSEGENEVGVAPDAQWIGARNMERGYGSPATYTECFEWFLAPTDINGENPDPDMAPHVIANSWSCPELEGCNSSNWAFMELAVNNLKASGVVVVVSAGNSGSACSTVSTPAAMFEQSFTIGATSADDLIAGFSSRGPVTVDGSNRMKPNVSAPGVNVRSSVPGGGYASFSGTSMAGPHVVGVVALMISANPSIAGDVEYIESVLEQTAVPKTADEECGGVSGANVPNNTYGFGRVDALLAVETVLGLVGINPPRDPNLQIYMSPNPFTSELKLEILNYTGNAEIEIRDLAGRLVWQGEKVVLDNLEEELQFPTLVSGIYIYQVRVGEDIFAGKLIRQ